MEELILVNISKAPVSLCLPSGRPVIVLPSFGIQGDYFAKYLSIGVLVPLSIIPPGHPVNGISQPLTMEGVRPNSEMSNTIGGNYKRPIPTPLVSKAAAVALATKGQLPSQEEVAKDLGINLPTNKDRLEGLSQDDWKSRLRQISDATIAQTMKLNQLRDLARFLEIDSADLMSTKAEIIMALKVKTRG